MISEIIICLPFGVEWFDDRTTNPTEKGKAIDFFFHFISF